MIEEDFVSIETAKLLKEKGFDEMCHMAYFNGTLVDYTMFGFCIGDDFVYAPTLQMATKWLRIVKKLDITIHYDSWACGGHFGYYIVVQRTDNDFSEVSPRVDEEDTVFFDTPESAFEAAIKYCLSALT